jgi:hypothetical protein
VHAICIHVAFCREVKITETSMYFGSIVRSVLSGVAFCLNFRSFLFFLLVFPCSVFFLHLFIYLFIYLAQWEKSIIIAKILYLIYSVKPKNLYQKLIKDFCISYLVWLKLHKDDCHFFNIFFLWMIVTFANKQKSLPPKKNASLHKILSCALLFQMM